MSIVLPVLVHLQDGRDIVLYEGQICYAEPTAPDDPKSPAWLHLSNGENVVCTSHPFNMWLNDALKRKI